MDKHEWEGHVQFAEFDLDGETEYDNGEMGPCKMAIFVSTIPEYLAAAISHYCGNEPVCLFCDIDLDPFYRVVIKGIGDLTYLTPSQLERVKKLKRII